MAKTLRNILIGTTLSEESDAVVKAGLSLAAASGATAHLVHVCPPLTAFGPLSGTSPVGQEAWLAAEVETLQEQLAAQGLRTGLALHDGGRGGRGRIELGLPHRVLEELAETVHADLIVLGASEAGHAGNHHPLGLGSTADRVIRKVACPVFLVRSASPFPPHQVLVPVDFSAGSAAALRYGLALLGELGRPPVAEVLFVLSPGESSIHFNPEQIARFAAEELQLFVARNLPEQIATTTRKVRSGRAVEQILGEIDERRPDLVILGPQGRSGLERVLIGNVAEKVLRRSPCSILVVPPETARRELLELERKAGADWSFVSDEMPQLAGAL